MMKKYVLSRSEGVDIIKALGLVFGDIGTSPIYTFTIIFVLLKPTLPNILGMLSLIVWTLVVLVSLEYVFLAMRLERHGEGGTLILKKIIDNLIVPGRKAGFISVLAFAGVSLLLGDGVITPSISILSAVEGLQLIPAFSTMHQWVFILIAMVIAVGLFIFQPKGTDTISSAFGPIMAVLVFSAGLYGLHVHGAEPYRNQSA